MFILDWIRNVAAAALSSEETAFATFDLACNCIDHEIAGDFVECGVFGGAQAAILDYSVKKTGPMYWKQQPLSLEKS